MWRYKLHVNCIYDLITLFVLFPSCISDETVTQHSWKDQLSKHYQVSVFKFIGKDNRVSQKKHAGSQLASVCELMSV